MASLPKLRLWRPIPYDAAARLPWRRLPFADAEYRRRIAQVQAIAQRRDLAAILVCGTGIDFADVRYLTGFPNHYKGEVMLLVPASGEPIQLTNAVAHGEPMHIEIYQTAIDDVRCAPSDRGRTQYADAPSLAGLLEDALRALGASASRLGVAGNAPTATRVLARLAGLATEDCSDALARLRAVKSAAELEVMRQAAAIADDALEAGLAAARAGASERDVAAAVAAELHRKGGDEPLYIIQAVSGPRSGFRNVGASDRLLEDGDPIYVGFGLRRHGYCARVGQGSAIGRPESALLRLLEANAAITEAAIAEIRPGVPVTAPLDAAWRCAVEHRVADDLWPGGHGIGVHTHDRPFVQADSRDVFEEGMVFVFEPVLYKTGFATANAERVFEVTSDGCKPLSRLPLRLWATR